VVNVVGITNGNFSLGSKFTVQNGSLLVSNVFACGENPGSPGTITVPNGTGSFSGTLCVGLNTNAAGSLSLTGGRLIMTNGPSILGVYGTGEMTVSNSSTLTSDQPVIVGLGAASQGTVTMNNSTWAVAGHLVVGQDLGAAGVVRITGGQLDVTNTFLTLIGGAGSAQHVWSNAMVSVGPLEVGADPGSPCALSIAGGINQISGAFVVGVGAGATGLVWITDGQIAATNAPVYIGSYGFGLITMSNGTWQGRDMVVGSQTASVGRVILTGGTMSLSTSLVVGKWSNSVGSVQLTGGNLSVANATGTAALVVGQRGQGTFTQSGGTLTVDQLLVANGTNSTFNFSSGVVNSKSATVSNAQMFIVGDGAGSATYHLLGGVHTFANDLRIRSNAKLTGCGTINGNVIVDLGGRVVADCGGTLTFTGSVTNNGIIHITNGTTVESYGPVVNYGTIDAINGSTNFHAGLVNYGAVITSNSFPQALSIVVVDSDVWISFTTENGWRYYFDEADAPDGAAWTPVIGFYGVGGIMTFIDTGAANLPMRFYRIRLPVPE
jgi:hypothetical protein